MKQDELNKEKEEYQILFENSPCYITVQDRNFKLLRFNTRLARSFNGKDGTQRQRVLLRGDILRDPLLVYQAPV